MKHTLSAFLKFLGAILLFICIVGLCCAALFPSEKQTSTEVAYVAPPFGAQTYCASDADDVATTARENKFFAFIKMLWQYGRAVFVPTDEHLSPHFVAVPAGSNADRTQWKVPTYNDIKQSQHTVTHHNNTARPRTLGRESRVPLVRFDNTVRLEQVSIAHSNNYGRTTSRRNSDAVATTLVVPTMPQVNGQVFQRRLIAATSVTAPFGEGNSDRPTTDIHARFADDIHSGEPGNQFMPEDDPPLPLSTDILPLLLAAAIYGLTKKRKTTQA